MKRPSSQPADPGREARERAGAHARNFFDALWSQGDYWKLETAAFDQTRYARSMELLADRHYASALEIGCGAGAFTGLLAAVADRVLAIDVSAVAIDRARQRMLGVAGVEFRVGNIIDVPLEDESPWDLIVMNDTVYYVGWLYSFFDVSWLAYRLFNATQPGGRFLMANTFGAAGGYLLRPWVIRTYHDLFLNVGFGRDLEETIHGTKDDAALDVLISVLGRPMETIAAT